MSLKPRGGPSRTDTLLNKGHQPKASGPLDSNDIVPPPGGTGVSQPMPPPPNAALTSDEATRLKKFLWFCLESLSGAALHITIEGGEVRPINVMNDQREMVLTELKWAIERLAQVEAQKEPYETH